MIVVLPCAVLLRKNMENLREYTLCRDDIFYFMEKYLKLEFREYQIEILSRYLCLQPNKTINIRSIREFGLSTINSIYMLWLVLFHPGTKIALISPTFFMAHNEKHTLSRLYDIFVTNWDKEQFKYRFSKFMSDRIIFDNNSTIIYSYDLGSTLIGQTFDVIVHDNLFLNPHPVECFRNTAPYGKKYIITNTTLPEKTNEMEQYGEISLYPWYCNEKLTQKWFLSTLNSLGNTEFERQFLCTRGNSNGEH